MRGSLRLHYVSYTWKRGLRSGRHGVDYSRFFEYPWAVDALRAGPDHALLDIGSGQGESNYGDVSRSCSSAARSYRA